jgi:hypothetical protein
MISVVTLTNGLTVALINKLDGSNLERIGIDTDDLVFTPMIVNQPVGTKYESVPLACLGKSLIVLKTEYSAATVEASLHVVLMDPNGLRLYSPKFQPQSTGSTDVLSSGTVHGVEIEYPVKGAATFLVRIAPDTPTIAGSVWVWGAAI